MKKFPKKNWSRLTLSVCLSAALSGCYQGPDPQKFFGSATEASLEIYFGGGEQVFTTPIEQTSDPELIRRYSSFIGPDKTKAYTCGYDGRIVFTKDDVGYDVNFNLDPSCRHFAYIIGDALYCRTITDEGLDYITEKITEASEKI